MYQISGKSTINLEIIPHLSVAKRGFNTNSYLSETVILYTLQIENRLSIGIYSFANDLISIAPGEE
jgi:hypothetical protein